MTHNQILFLLLITVLASYLFVYIKKRPAALLFFAGRSAAGLSYLYLFQSFCTARGIDTHLGVNLITAALSAFLGIPGILLAYAANLLRFF